jgi:CheY-like chemotaxis protein/anti-sigma regulatory factor (Ser/Thr protein kinase)
MKWMFRELTENKGLELTFEQDAELPRVLLGDEGKVRQVVINLLSNAVKFTERGRVAVHASSRPARVDRHTVVITVEDTGPGIEPKDLARVFDAFHQAEPRVGKGGTGLGLAISRNYARLMDGDVVVETTPGKGSVFTFRFEAATAAVSAVSSPVVSPLPVGLAQDEPAWKVLIVDDVATNRDLLDELLSRIGFTTRMAASGEEAIVMHHEWQPDLVLMDVRMPGMSGLEAVRRLRESRSKATIIAVTASGLADTEGEAREAGVDAFVRKPYRASELLSLIGERLGVHYVYASTGGDSSVAHRKPVGRTTLLQQFSSLPSALIDQLRDAALEGRAKRLEALADQAEEHSEAVSAEIRLLARNFEYGTLVSALPSRTRDDT